MSDEIPDPTELRQKLGITRRTEPDPEEFKHDGQAVMSHLSEQKGKAITLADYEPVKRRVDRAEAGKIHEILAHCPAAAAEYIKKYIVLGNKSAAFRAIDYSSAMGKYWRDRFPQFAALEAFYAEEVRQRWNEVSERRALEGFQDIVLKEDGTVKFTRMKQDPQFLVQMMRRLDPDWKDEQGSTQITINVTRTDE